MIQPGRKYQAGTTSYRYSINGQEKDSELNENITTAEYWVYDSRIGRRWNVDPVVKEYESPYATFGNNPIWNVDYDGSDTAKYLSNGQLRDAMKIASNQVKDVIKNKSKFHSKQVDKSLSDATDVYLDKNQMNFGASAEFQTAVQQYYERLSHLAWWSGTPAFERLDRLVINNPGVDDKWSLKLSIANIRDAFGGSMSILTTSANVALGIAAGAIGPQTGQGPKGTFSSNSQQLLVESQAGFKFTNTTIKQFVDPSRTVSATDLRRTVGSKAYTDPQGASGTSAYYSTILRNGKSYNLKVIYHQESNTIFHFHYSRQAMGPLPKIKK